jgi:hypothetical protein
MAAWKGESYETQDQNQGRKARFQPQHYRSLKRFENTRLCGKSRSSPKNQETWRKENHMKLKTKIKAGRLAANHNTIVR